MVCELHLNKAVTNKQEECTWKLTSKSLAIITKGQICGDFKETSTKW